MRGRKALFPIIMISAGALLLIGSALWFVGFKDKTGSASASSQDIRIPHPEVPRISVDDAKAAFDLGTAVFIDTRGEPYYSEGHIPGALSISVDELPDRLDELDPANWVITYCT
jgi:3-mercaptopyruvate sulfurtransferase SseA